MTFNVVGSISDSPNSLVIQRSSKSCHELCLFILFILYHFSHIICVSQFQMATQILTYVVRIAVRVGYADRADSRHPVVHLTHVLYESFSG